MKCPNIRRMESMKANEFDKKKAWAGVKSLSLT